MMDWPLVRWVTMLRKPTAREAITTFLLLLPLLVSLLYRLYAKIRRRDGRSVGLQILSHESDDGYVKYEIIAVHGLGASPEHTWTCKPSSKSRTNDSQKSVHLLKDLLMKDERFSDARILHFAYNSDWLVDACFESARDIGLRLIESLIERRKTHPRLPLIFVGHSFGGIVIKEALSSDQEDTQRILEDTCGIIFLGTPHLGSPVAGFGAALAYLTGFLGSNTGLLLLLRSNGEMLVNLSITFQTCLERKYLELDKKTKIVSICEQKPTYLLNWLYAGLIVPLASATFGTNFMEVFKVDKDHSGLNKCTDLEDPLYKVLTTQLHKIRPTAPPKINTLQQAVLDRLSSVTAADAEFHPRLDEYGRARSECLPQTREEILKDICDWLDDSTSSQKHLYWLQGKAGTGKSTIARTIVSRMTRQNRITANFFFKRGEGDRVRLKRFFTTLATQLARKWASFAEAVQDALESDPSLPEQDPRVQFKKLIQEPMRKQKSTRFKATIIVIDALDECESSEDLTTLVQQLTQPILQDGPSAQLLVKYFITSRLDSHTRAVSNETTEQMCEKQELEKAASETITQDIELYLRFQLEKIDGFLSPLPRGEPWSNPSDLENLKKLTERASPLFEFAAAACRFIGQTTIPGEPRDLLNDILESQTSGDLSTLYESILKRRFYNAKDQYYARIKTEFQKVIGSVVSLADSVGVGCLALLIDLSESAIRRELQHFQSVLVVPTEEDNESPVRLFHESFRDFLLGPGTNEEFKIDSIKAHGILASRCHQLLRGSLHENMCKLKTSGTYQSEVPDETINKFLPQEVQYACRFWIFHVKRSQSVIKDGDDWHLFLLTHFLHWLEAQSLLGRISETASLVRDLKPVIHPSDGVLVKAFLDDAERLILSFRQIISDAPLQLYSSVMTFAPIGSLVRQTFEECRAKWIARAPNAESQWSPCLQTLEGHTLGVSCVAISSEGILASVSQGGMVKVWDPILGVCMQTFYLRKQRHYSFESVAFSRGGKLACLTLHTVAVWDIYQGICLQEVDYVPRSTPHVKSISSVVFIDEQKLLITGGFLNTVLMLNLGQDCEEQFKPSFGRRLVQSSDGHWVASADGEEVRVFDMNSKPNYTYKVLKEAVIGHSGMWSACFSQDNRYFASILGNTQIKIWDVSSTTCLQTLNDIDRFTVLVFSEDSRLLATAHDEKKMIIWDWKKCTRLQTLTGHRSDVNSLAFSLDGAWLASASDDKTIKIWDTTTCTSEEKQTDPFTTREIIIAKDSQRFATLSNFGDTAHLWDDNGGEYEPQPFVTKCDAIAYSANGNIFAAALKDGDGVQIWDVETGNYLPKTNSSFPRISSIALSLNGERIIASSRGGRVEAWESRTGQLLKVIQFPKPPHYAHNEIIVAISSDGKQIALFTDRLILTEDLSTGVTREFGFPIVDTYEMRFSQNGQRLAAVSRLWVGAIWDLSTGALLRRFDRSKEPEPFDMIWYLHPSFIDFDFTTAGELPEERAVVDCLTKYCLSPDGAWIMRYTQKLLWLPLEYRPNAAAISGRNIAIGRRRGCPFVIELSDDGLNPDNSTSVGGL